MGVFFGVVWLHWFVGYSKKNRGEMIMSAIDFYIGISILLGLALIFTYMVKKTMLVFMSFFVIFSPFVVMSGLLDIWVSILGIIFLITLLIFGRR